MATIRRICILVLCITSTSGVSYEMRRLASASNQFGFDLMRIFPQQNASFALCPFCLSSELAIIATGLDPADRLYSAIRSILYIQQMSPIDFRIAYGALLQHINDFEQFVAINRIFVQQFLPINYHYYLMLQRDFKTSVNSVEMERSPRQPSNNINSLLYSTLSVENILTHSSRILQDKHFLILSGASFEAELLMDFAGQSSKRNKRGLFTRLKQRIQQNRIQAFHQKYMVPMKPLASENVRVMVNTPKPDVVTLLSELENSTSLVFSDQDGEQTTESLTKIFSTTEAIITTTTAAASSTTTSVSATESSTSTTARTNTLPRPTKRPFNPFEPISTEQSDMFAEHQAKQKQKPQTSQNKRGVLVRLAHSEYLQASLIEVPFSSGFLSMIFLVPDNALEQSISRLNMQVLRDTQQQLSVRLVKLQVPELLLETALPNWMTLLNSLGLETRSLNDSHYFGGMDEFRLWHRIQLEQLTRINITRSRAVEQSSLSPSNLDDVQTTALDLTRTDMAFFVFEPISGLILVAGRRRPDDS